MMTASLHVFNSTGDHEPPQPRARRMNADAILVQIPNEVGNQVDIFVHAGNQKAGDWLDQLVLELVRLRADLAAQEKARVEAVSS